MNKQRASSRLLIITIAFIIGITFTFYNTTDEVSAASKPAKVTISSVKSVDHATIQVKWKKAKSAKKYQVYRATSKNGKYKKIKTTTSCSYTNKGLTTGKKYYYKVRGVNGSKKGKFSSKKYAVPTLNKPANLIVSDKKATSVKLSWSKVNGAAGYQVYRSVYPNGKYTKVATTKNPYFVNSGLSAGKTYHYKVRAYKSVKKKYKYSSYSTLMTTAHQHVWKEDGYTSTTRMTDICVQGYCCYPCGVVFTIYEYNFEIVDDDKLTIPEQLEGTTLEEQHRVADYILSHNYKESIYDHCENSCPQSQEQFMHLCPHIYGYSGITQMNVNYNYPTIYSCSCGATKEITQDNCNHTVRLLTRDGIDVYSADRRASYVAPDEKYLKAPYHTFNGDAVKTECLSCGKITMPSYEKRMEMLNHYNEVQGTEHTMENLRSVREGW